MPPKAHPSTKSGKSSQLGASDAVRGEPRAPTSLSSAGRYGSLYLGDMHPDGAHPPRWHNQANLVVALNAGLCEVTHRFLDAEAKAHHVTGDQFCLIGARAKVDVRCHIAGTIAVIGIDPAALPEYSPGNSEDVVLHNLGVLARADVLIWDIVARFRNLCRPGNAPSGAYLESLATIFSVHVLQAGAEPTQAPKPGLSPAQMRHVHEFITSHIAQPLDIATMAREVNLSAYHFTRLFKRTTGIPPHHYLIERRVEKAHLLLADGNHRVADAAYAVGFCDQSHLDRHFRQKYGYAPRTLIRQHAAQV